MNEIVGATMFRDTKTQRQRQLIAYMPILAASLRGRVLMVPPALSVIRAVRRACALRSIMVMDSRREQMCSTCFTAH